MTKKYEQSRFVFNSDTMEITEGKAPTKQGQLWKGEDHRGEKMELAGTNDGNPVAYWGWS